MKVTIFLLGFILTLSSAFGQGGAHGGVIGGGGSGVVCRNGNEIVSVELLDLYESSILNERSYDSMESMSLDEVLNWAALKLTSYNSEGKNYFDLFKNIEKNFKYLPTGVRLETISDSGHIFIPVNCKVEQVANFYTSNKIFIVSDFYSKMDNLSKAALIVHEALYEKERRNNVEDSRYVRRVVGAIFDKSFKFEDPTLGTTSKKILCSSPIGKNDFFFGYDFNPGLKKVTRFEVIQDGNWNRLQFAMLNGHVVYSRKQYYISRYENISYRWAERGISQGGGFQATETLDSNFDENEEFTFDFQQVDANIMMREIQPDVWKINRIKLSWKGSHPGDSFENVEFACWFHTEMEH